MLTDDRSATYRRDTKFFLVTLLSYLRTVIDILSEYVIFIEKKGGIYIEADAVTDALSWLCLIDCFDIWNWIWNDISKW